MTKEEVKERFTDFLKEEGVYEQFCKNLTGLNMYPGITIDYFIDAVYEDYPELVGYVFVWRYSQEWYKFWKKIDRKWKKYIKTIKKD